MQSQITSLKANSSSSSSLPTPHQPRSSRALESGEDGFSDVSSVHESTSISSSKRLRSPSPHEEVEEDPTYRKTLAAIRALLQVEVPEESSDQPLGLRTKTPGKSRFFQWSCPHWKALFSVGIFTRPRLLVTLKKVSLRGFSAVL